MKHVMIDLETMATTPQAAVVSIGAVYFSPSTGELGDVLHLKLDIAAACKGRALDPNTIKWWLGQGRSAREGLLKGGMECQINALTILANFLKVDNVTVWGNGSTFDISILEDWYRQLDIEIPWKYYNVRDMRTVVDLAEGIVDKNDFEFEGIKHNALDDAKHQARVVSAMWRALRGI